MPFDRAGAFAAGYSEEEIQAFLAQSAPQPQPQPAPMFDRDSAKASGYSDQEIDSYLSSGVEPAAAPGARSQIGADFERGGRRAAQSLASAFGAMIADAGNAQLGRLTPEMQVESREDMARFTAEQQQQINTLPVRPVMRAIGESEGLGGMWDAFLQDPLGALMSLGVESAPVAGATAVGAVLGGLPGAAATTFTAGGVHARQQKILERLEAEGVNTASPGSLRDALATPELIDPIADEASLYGGVIGAGSAAMLPLARLNLLPQVVQGPLGKVGSEAANVLAQTAVQGAGGAATEATAQAASTGEVGRPGDVLLEGLGGAISAPVDIATVGSRAVRDRLRGEPAAPAHCRTG